MPGFRPLNPLSPPLVATVLFHATPLDDHILPLDSYFHYIAIHTLSVNVLIIRLHYRSMEHLSTFPETIVLTTIPRCSDIAGSLHFHFRVICSRLHPSGVLVVLLLRVGQSTLYWIRMCANIFCSSLLENWASVSCIIQALGRDRILRCRVSVL